MYRTFLYTKLISKVLLLAPLQIATMAVLLESGSPAEMYKISHISWQHIPNTQLQRTSGSFCVSDWESSSHHLHVHNPACANTVAGHFIFPSTVPLSSTVPFFHKHGLIHWTRSCPFSSHSNTVRAAKGTGFCEKLSIQASGIDSLQTAFSFCSCDGLALSWVQMKFAFLICRPHCAT